MSGVEHIMKTVNLGLIVVPGCKDCLFEENQLVILESLSLVCLIWCNFDLVWDLKDYFKNPIPSFKGTISLFGLL